MAIGSSGSGISDLNPEKAYDVDVRRLDKTERRIDRASDVQGERKQDRVGKFLRSARSAGKFQMKRQIDGPWTNREGQIPAFTEGDRFGRAGSTNYADKPQPSTSKLYY